MAIARVFALYSNKRDDISKQRGVSRSRRPLSLVSFGGVLLIYAFGISCAAFALAVEYVVGYNK